LSENLSKKVKIFSNIFQLRPSCLGSVPYEVVKTGVFGVLMGLPLRQASAGQII
jgi:hypothetical protein